MSVLFIVSYIKIPPYKSCNNFFSYSWLIGVINVPKDQINNITKTLLPRDTDPLNPPVHYKYSSFTRACMYRYTFFYSFILNFHATPIFVVYYRLDFLSSCTDEMCIAKHVYANSSTLVVQSRS